MTVAELHGKIPKLEGREDLLTSDVFSAFRYLPVNLGLIPFLRKAIHAQTAQPIPNLFEDCLAADYIFWPKTTHYKREPDILLLITRKTKPPIAIIIEAKYYSGRHDANREQAEKELQALQGDQLAEQYVDLMKNEMDLNKQQKQMLHEADHRFLLFVTAHDAPPREITDDSINKLVMQHYKGDQLYWTNWQAAFDVANETLATQILADEQRYILEDLRDLLLRKGLKGFHLPAKLHQSEHYFWREEQWSIGEEMKKVYDKMVKVYTETGRLIAVIESEFAKKGWIAIGDHGVTWDTSKSYEYPNFWLPYFMQRVYTNDDDKKGVAFNILFDGLDEDHQIAYPILSCAVAERKDEHPLIKCSEITWAGWKKDSHPLSAEYQKLYQTDDTDLTIINYFLPLDKITREAAVRALIVKPLIQMYEGKFEVSLR